MIYDVSGKSSPFTPQIAEDARSATISVGNQELTITTKQLEEAIWWLGDLRMRMSPIVSEALPKDALPAMTPVTNWDVPRFDPAGPCAVYLRSTQFGWMAFQFARESRLALVDTLTTAQPTAPQRGTMN